MFKINFDITKQTSLNFRRFKGVNGVSQMNDKDKLRAELLQDLKNEGADEAKIPLFDKIIRIMTEEKNIAVPKELIEKTRTAISLSPIGTSRKQLFSHMPRKISLPKLITRAAVALIAFALIFGGLLMDNPGTTSTPTDKILIASADKTVVENVDGVEYMADPNTSLIQHNKYFELKNGEIVVNSYNIDDNLNFQVNDMNVQIAPKSIVLLQNRDKFSQVSVFKGQAEVETNNQLQMLDANTDKKILYFEQNAFSQPVDGSLEKFAELLYATSKKANLHNSINTQNWANSQKSKNLIVDQFIYDAENKRSILVKRVDISDDGIKCSVIFNIDKKEKRFEVKKGANIGSWIVTNMSKTGFEIHDGAKKISFLYKN